MNEPMPMSTIVVECTMNALIMWKHRLIINSIQDLKYDRSFSQGGFSSLLFFRSIEIYIDLVWFSAQSFDNINEIEIFISDYNASVMQISMIACKIFMHRTLILLVLGTDFSNGFALNINIQF